MSAPSAHDKDRAGLSNLTLARSHTHKTAMLTMQLPESTMDTPSGSTTKDDCYIQEVRRGGGGRKSNLNRVATKVIFRFAIQSNDLDALKVQVTHQQPGDVYSQTFPKSPTPGPLVFKFNNGCGGFCTHNDSIDLYDVFTDKRSNGLQFVTGSLKNNEVPGNDPDNPWPIGKNKKLLSSTYGNCDPVGSNPPPEGPWPPA
jgi:hypothetical protein